MYAQLRQWHEEHGTAIELLLFPSDEFGRQELPEEQIAPFVRQQGLSLEPGSGVTLLSKGKVNGPHAEPLWVALKAAFPGEVSWNFAAIFLVGTDGIPVARFTARQLGTLDTALRDMLG